VVAVTVPSGDGMTTTTDLRGDVAIVTRLRRGDEAAFVALVDTVGPTMLRLVLAIVGNRAVAEDVVQDAWVSVLRALDRFEGRSSLRTWICAIALNAARKRVARDRGTVPVAGFESEHDPGDPLVGAFFERGHPRWAEAWCSTMSDWHAIPEQQLLSNETRAVLARAVATLPESQRAVFLLYDVEGWSAAEICNVLELTGSNQRVLLHRARIQLRAALDSYFDHEGGTGT
jgi:RNA polymerase sigma-70 factor (ECF subfamily)